MDPLTFVRLSAVLGGLAWVVRWVADRSDGGGPLAPGLHVAGLVLLAVALAGAGAALVSTSATWLRVIVAVAFPVLVWSVLELLHGAGSATAVDGVAGAVAVVVAAVALGRARARRTPPAGPGDPSGPSDPSAASPGRRAQRGARAQRARSGAHAR